MTQEQLTNIIAALERLDLEHDRILQSQSPIACHTLATRLNILHSKVSILQSLTLNTIQHPTDTPTETQAPPPHPTNFGKHAATLRTISTLLPTLADPLTPPAQLALILILNERLTTIETLIETTITNHTPTARPIKSLLPPHIDPLTPPAQLALILILEKRLTTVEKIIEATIEKNNATPTPTPTENDEKHP